MILSGIFFLRSLRHHRTGQSHWRIRQANIFYLGLIFVTYLISQSLWLRHQLRRIVGVFYQVVMTPINRVLEAFNQWLFADPEGIMVEELAETSEPPPGLGEAGEEIMQGAEAAFTGSIIGNIVMALFLLLTIYLVYRVFIRRYISADRVNKAMISGSRWQCWNRKRDAFGENRCESGG